MIPAQLAKDITETLARLQIARLVGDEPEARVVERRLNWLIEKIPVKEKVVT